MTWGDPLCEPKELEKVMRAYLKWLHDERKLGPIWLNASKATQTFLSSALEWRALSVTTEQIINLDDMHRLQSEEDKAVKRRVHRLERDGLKAVWLEGRMDAKTKSELDAGIESWKRGRKGEQVHTTEVRPYADARHRTFLLAKDKNDKVSACCGFGGEAS